MKLTKQTYIKSSYSFEKELRTSVYNIGTSFLGIYYMEFTTYSAGGFSWDDQVRTAELLAKHRGPVLLSNQATRRIVALYRSLKFDLKFLDAPRRISCNGNREAAREVLAMRNLAGR